MLRHGVMTVSWLALALALAAPGCRRPVPRAEKPPHERTVVSLVPSVTETLFAMGLGPRVVARSSYCTYPEEARVLPVVGDARDVSFERVLQLRPDLVVFNTSDARFYDRLTSAGIRCLSPRMETVDDVYAVIDLLGRELGAEAQGERLVLKLRSELLAAKNLVEQRGRGDVGVLVTFPATVGGGGDVRVVGRDTFVDELLTLAGGRNVVPLDRYATVSVETVVTWAPEVIVISAPGDIAPGLTDEQYRSAWSRWDAIPAVRSGRVVVLRESYLTIPGPRMGRAARLLVGVLHPDGAAAPENAAQ